MSAASEKQPATSSQQPAADTQQPKANIHELSRSQACRETLGELKQWEQEQRQQQQRNTIHTRNRQQVMW